MAFPNGLTYTPGTPQQLTVTIQDSAQKRWGFEMSARLSSSSTTQAGSFTAGGDGYTQVACASANLRSQQSGSACSTATYPLKYIEQTLSGTRNGTTGQITFQFSWTPPATNVGNVSIYISANAANGNNNESGDHIYTTNYTLTPAVVTTNTPSITSGGVVNAAGYQQTIAPNTYVTITGTNLDSNSTPRAVSGSDIVNNTLPTSLDGVSVTINNKAAYITYVSPTQINALAPSDTSKGSVMVQVTSNGVASNSYTAQEDSQSPAFFLWAGKYAVATRQDYSLAAPNGTFAGTTTVPAKPGDVIILWGTGFGATTPASTAGQLADPSTLYSVANPPSITIGGIQATVYAAALAPGYAGLYQIAIQVPPTAGNGDQPIVAQIGSVSSPTGVSLNIQQ